MSRKIRESIIENVRGFNNSSVDPSDIDESNVIVGLDLDYDIVSANINSEYTSLANSHNTEMDNYNRSYRAYAMEPMGNEIVGMSQTITPLIYEKVEWISATINKIITESNDAYDVVPMGANNAFPAEVAKLVLNDVIGSGADAHNTLTDFIRSSFIAGNSYIKCGWSDPTPCNPVGHFTFECVPNERLRWDHDYGSFYKSPCVYDTTMESMSDIILAAESDGDWMIDRLSDALSETGGEGGADSTKSEADRYNTSSSSGSASVDKPTDSRGMYQVTECWTHYDIDDDGVAEPVVAVFVNSYLVRFVKNQMPDGKHPYICTQGKRNPHEALGWTMEKVLGHNQRNATMIDRMIINNISSQDNGIMMYNERNVSPLAAQMHKRGLPRTMLPVGDIGNSIAPVPGQQLPPHVQQYKDNILSTADGLSGYTKSVNLDVQMLKGTANNGNIVNSSGQTRIWDDTKRILEMGYKPLAMKCLAYCSQWMTTGDFEKRFGIALSKKEVKELFSSVRHKINVSVSLPSDNAEKLQQMMNWAQYFLPQAQPGQDGQMSEHASAIAKAGEDMAFYAAKLMGIPEFERALNGGKKFVGINGLSVSQEDIDSFRAGISGGDREGELDQEFAAEAIANAEAGIEAEEELLRAADDGGLGNEEAFGIEGVFGTEQDVQGGDGLLP